MDDVPVGGDKRRILRVLRNHCPRRRTPVGRVIRNLAIGGAEGRGADRKRTVFDGRVVRRRRVIDHHIIDLATRAAVNLDRATSEPVERAADDIDEISNARTGGRVPKVDAVGEVCSIGTWTAESGLGVGVYRKKARCSRAREDGPRAVSIAVDVASVDAVGLVVRVVNVRHDSRGVDEHGGD